MSIWPNFKNLIWKERGILITTPTVAIAVVILRCFGLLQPFELGALDLLFRLRPTEPIDKRIIIVGFDEKDVKKYNDPMSDQVLAQLIEKIKKQKAKAIGLDFYRDLPVGNGNKDLVKVFQTTPNLIGIEKEDKVDPSLAVAPPPVLAKLNQVGLNNNVVDNDGKLRRAMVAESERPTLGMMLAGIYLGSFPEISKDKQVLTWGKGIFPKFKPNDGGYWKADDGGFQFILNYKGPSGKSFQTISVSSVLDGKIPPNLLKDKIVLIGATATSLNNFFYTPYSNNDITRANRTSGIEIQANVISQLLSGALEGRTNIKTPSEPVQWLWIVLWSAIGATLSWKLRYTNRKKTFSLQKSAAFVGSFIVLIGITYLAWLGGWWIPIVAPMLGLTGSIAAITAFNARNASEIRKIFGRYLNDEVVANLLESQEGLKMGGERRKITLLTSDLRGFTARSDSLSPEYVVKIMNLYFEQMAEIITKHKGVIDEYMGDGILVLFGAPSKREDDAERAIACALEMQIGINKVNEKLKEWKVPALEMGIGINTGEVVVGNIGSEKRTKYGVIGGQVNLTYRIESFTIGGQIFISESTIQELDQKNLRIDNQKKIEAKGVKEPISIYQIGGITGEYNLFLPKQEQEEFYSLSQPISFEYQVLDEKLIIKNKSKGQLLKISSSGAIIKTEGHTLKVFSNLKIKISIDGNEEEIYAKIISLVKSETFYINFTYIGKIYKTLIKRVINQQ